jgi:protein-tyrosine phosphatase
MDHVKYDSEILHIVYPLLDGKNENIAAFFDAFYHLIETNITRGSILVHCAAGISRVLSTSFRAALWSSPT